MYLTIQDFLNDWKDESEATLKVFKNLNNASLNQKVTPDGRSLGFLAWHIVTTLGEMGEKAGLKIPAPPENAPVPTTAAEIVTAYEKAAPMIAEEVKTKWTDEKLLEEINMYGQMWTRRKILNVLIIHEVHHRAQMTVLMRQAGLKVPGVCGPSKEEWSQYGMQAPE